MLKRLVAAGAALMIIAGAATVFAQQDHEKMMSKSPYDGTYQLVKRELPDGTVLKPPAVVGLFTIDNGWRNFNVAWKDPEGKQVQISVISKCTLSETEYSETNVFYMQNNVPGADGIMYDLNGHSGTAKVTKTDAGLSWDMPLHGEPHVTMTPNTMIAEREGAFKDYWEKIK